MQGRRYSVFEYVYLRPWPNSEPWVARIEEIVASIGRSNKVQQSLSVRWFYRRRDLLPSGECEFPACDNEAREVYLVPGKLDQVEIKTLLGSCKVVCSTDVPDLAAYLQEDDTYFYRYEYDLAAAKARSVGTAQRDKQCPLFRLPGGKPLGSETVDAPKNKTLQ